MLRKSVRHFLEYVVFRTIVCVILALPTRATVAGARAAAYLVHRILPRKLTRYQIAAENLRIAFGNEMSDEQLDCLIHRMWLNLFRMVVEIIHVRNKLRLYNCVDVVKFRNRDVTARALCSGRPVILLSGHFGNWEVANSTTGWFGFPMGVVARDLDNPWLHQWFERFRQHTGHRMISKKGGSQEMVRIMERRGLVALLGDQDAGGRGLFVDFFGKRASTFKSIALLALQHRALICVSYTRRLPDDFENNRWVRFEMGSEEIIDPDELPGDANDVQRITEAFTLALERAVRLAPEQYFWVHRRWKSKPTARQQRRRRRTAA